MSNLRRYYREGDLYFTTHVTYRRIPYLEGNELLLLDACSRVRARTRFQVIAWCILPDHFHAIFDPALSDLSDIVKRIKRSFSNRLCGTLGVSGGPIWQHRFWDHAIRDDEDLRRHLDYIHYNAVRHGAAESPSAWPYSSFTEYVARGQYANDWSPMDERWRQGDFGE